MGVFQRTVVVLDNFDHEINAVLGGYVHCRWGTSCSNYAPYWFRPDQHCLSHAFGLMTMHVST